MTISSTTSETLNISADGSKTIFSFDFSFTDTSQIKVISTIDSVNYEISSGITISEASTTGGNVTFSEAPAAGSFVSIIRVMDYKQQADFLTGGSGEFSPAVVESALDKLTMQDLETKAIADRGIKFSETSTSKGTIAAPEEGKGVYWKSGELVTSDEDLNTIVSSAKASQDAAKTSQESSADSASLSQNSATDSKNYAINPYNSSFNPSSGEVAYSSLHYSTIASDKATKAEEYKVSAEKAERAAAAHASSSLYSTVTDITYSNSPVTITTSDAGKLYRCNTSGGNIAFTLPELDSSNSAEIQFAFAKMDNSSNDIVVSPYAGDQINSETGHVKHITGYHQVETFISDKDNSNWLAFGPSTTHGTQVKTQAAGDGSTISFTLPNDVLSNDILVFISGVYQAESTYSHNGKTITFAVAPPAPETGITNNIEMIQGTAISVADVPAQSVNTEQLVNSSVTSDKIKTGAVTSAKLPASVINSSTLLADGVVTGAKLAADFFPAGIIMPFAGVYEKIPSGWKLCDGWWAGRVAYSRLFAVIGTTYGVGDGSSNSFSLPDLRGEFIRGLDRGRNVDSGRTLGSSQADGFKSHNHTGNYIGAVGVLNDHIYSADKASAVKGSVSGNLNINSAVPSDGINETRPRNIAMNYIIKT